MLLLIDNYDSFTYNLYQYLCELGAEVQVRRNDEVTVQDVESLAPEQVVISPGPCTPLQAGISNEIIRRFHSQLPILGVCLGHQCIGHVFGGAIKQAPELRHGKTSEIRHAGKGVFAGLANPMTATRYHSLIIDRETLPECLEITGWTDDGLVMGIQHREFPLFGVQFHPESILTVGGKDLLRNFLELGVRQ
jgi:anthranilate synthase component II